MSAERVAGTGPELTVAVAELRLEDADGVQAVAFAVACGVRDVGEEALPALGDLLVASEAAAADTNDGTLINLLSAVQYAAMLPDEARAEWAPPAGAIASVVRRGLASSESLREQAADLVAELVDEGLADAWLGRDAAADLIGG